MLLWHWHVESPTTNLPEGAYLDLHVKVEKHWQDRKETLDRLGY